MSGTTINMTSWLGIGPDGTECLFRAGAGVVSAVYPAPGRLHHVVVEILAVPPADRMKALRYTLSPVISVDDPLDKVAMAALQARSPVSWRMRWQRHAWIYPSISLTSLDTEVDVYGALEDLVPLEDGIAPVRGGNA